MTALLNVVLPVFALIALGYLCRRVNVLGPAAVTEINRFVVWLAQPALLFGITANAHWSSYRLISPWPWPGLWSGPSSWFWP